MWFLVLMAVLGGALWSLRWVTEAEHARGDTFWYTKQTLQLSGMPEDDATAKAAEYIVSLGRGASTSEWLDAAAVVDPRYPSIFNSRPIYPLTAVAFVPFAGVHAMAVSSFIAGLFFAVVLGSMGLWATGSMIAATSTVVLAYLLPSGHYVAYLFAESWMLGIWSLALLCAGWFLTRGHRWSLAAFAATLVVLYLTKSANGAVLAAAVASAGIVVWLWPGSGTQSARGLALAGVAVACALIQIPVFAALGWPGLNDTLQDLFTRHFTHPDVEAPLSLLIPYITEHWTLLMAALLPHPLLPIGMALALMPLLLIRQWWATLWFMAGVLTILTVIVHPLESEGARLMSPIWLSVAVAGGICVAALLPRVRELVARFGNSGS